MEAAAGDIEIECYNCFSIGFHHCHQNIKAIKEFVCETCGNLKSPFQLVTDINNKTSVNCLWCNKSLTAQDIAEFRHILACPERKIQSFGEFFKYHCICSEVAAQKEWLLLK